MRLNCLSSFRTNTFDSETELDLAERDLSVASIVREVTRSREPDFDTPSIQPPRPVHSSRKLISHLLQSEVDEGTKSVQVKLEDEKLMVPPNEGGQIAVAFGQNSILADLHRGRMRRFLKYTKTQSRISQNFTPWKKKPPCVKQQNTHGTEFQNEVCSKQIIRNSQSMAPKMDQINTNTQFTLSNSLLETRGNGGDETSCVRSVKLDRSFRIDDPSEENTQPIQTHNCFEKKRRIKFNNKWCSSHNSKRSRTGKDRRTISGNESEIRSALQNRIKAAFKFWRPSTS
eukprot:g7436.t1